MTDQTPINMDNAANVGNANNCTGSEHDDLAQRYQKASAQEGIAPSASVHAAVRAHALMQLAANPSAAPMTAKPPAANQSRLSCTCWPALPCWV